jgi:hypothetical protein
MNKKIFYNGNEAYQVVRTIGMDDCNPKRYGINRSDEHSYMKVLQVWRNHHYCDHVLQSGNKFMLCRTIKDVEIIE